MAARCRCYPWICAQLDSARRAQYSSCLDNYYTTSMPKRTPATIKSLQQLGFSEYEARAYVALVRRNPVNGYELAKEAAVPRPNIYSVLDKLSARGAVLVQHTPGGTRYRPLAPRQLMERLGSAHKQLLDATVTSLESLESATGVEMVLNARGYSTLLDHARAAIRQAGSSVLLALHPAEAAHLEAEITDTERRNVTVTILCLYACPGDCGHCNGKAYRYRVAPLQRAARWLIAVADARTLVAGEITGEEDTQAVITHQRLVIELAASFIRQSIALATLIEDPGIKLDQSVSARTHGVLNALNPQGENGTFIDYMRRLMAETPQN